jgi:hypothetical protein
MLVTLVPAVVACVLLHWLTLEGYIRRYCHRRRRYARALLTGVLVLTLVHLLEITLFAGMLFVMHGLSPGTVGGLIGLEIDAFYDVWYFVACVYTTVGFGDIVPIGPARFFAGVVALVGLLMITWSASFTFLVMQQSWTHRFQTNGPDDR